MKISERDIRRALYKKDFYEFFKWCWTLIESEPLIESKHIKVICDKLQVIGFRVIKREEKEHDYYIINLPPGSSKSRIVSIIYNLWLWINDPTIKVISGSYSMHIATKFSLKTRDILTDPRFKELFPIELKSDQNNKTDYANTSGGERFTTSTGSSVTGMHGHIILIDDPLNTEESFSDTDRETANRWISETLSSRKINRSIVPTILIMQRLHEDDPAGHLMNKGVDCDLLCLPAELDDNVHPPELEEIYTDGLLDPVRIGTKVLEEAKLNLGTIGYATQYGQKAAPKGGSILKPEWFGFISLEEFNRLFPKAVFDGDLDSAYGNSNKADPSGFLASTVQGNITYIRYAEEKNLTFPELKKYMVTFAERNGFTSKSRFYVEPKASGISVVQDLMDSKLNVVQFDAPKESKVLRAQGVSAYNEAGKAKIIGSPNDPWVKAFLGQIEGFPNLKNDNMVDVFVQACLRGKRATAGNTKMTFHKLGPGKVIRKTGIYR